MELQEFKDKVIAGQVLSNLELVQLLGTEAQKESYKKNNKLYINTKKALLRELESYCTYEEIKINKIYYKIVKIHEHKKNLDKRKNNKSKSKYIELIENIIVNKMLESNLDNMRLTNTKLMYQLSFINSAYVDIFNRKKATLEKKDIDYSNYLVFNSILRKDFMQIIDRAIKALDKKRIISSQKTYCINITDSKRENIIFECDDNMNKAIRKIEFNELQKLNKDKNITIDEAYRNYSDILNTNVLKEIEKQFGQVFSFMYDNDYELNYYYRATVIMSDLDTLKKVKDTKKYITSSEEINLLAQKHMLDNTNNKNTYDTKAKNIKDAKKLISNTEIEITDNEIIKYKADATKLIDLFIQN